MDLSLIMASSRFWNSLSRKSICSWLSVWFLRIFIKSCALQSWGFEVYETVVPHMQQIWGINLHSARRWCSIFPTFLNFEVEPHPNKHSTLGVWHFLLWSSTWLYGISSGHESQTKSMSSSSNLTRRGTLLLINSCYPCGQVSLSSSHFEIHSKQNRVSHSSQAVGYLTTLVVQIKQTYWCLTSRPTLLSGGITRLTSPTSKLPNLASQIASINKSGVGSKLII